jgi:hypothetical protein
MKLRILLLIALAGIVAPFSIADTIQFLGVPTGVNDGQYYDLPYQIAIDGTADLVACYDIFDDVNFGDIWQANLLTLTQAAASGYFSMDANALAGYERIAWLDAQPYQNAAEQIGLQYAIWNVFGSSQSSADAVIYEAEANAAAAAGYGGFDFSDVRFIEQVGGVSGRPGTEQAFVYWQAPPRSELRPALVTPELPTSILLLSALAVTGFAFRRGFGYYPIGLRLKTCQAGQLPNPPRHLGLGAPYPALRITNKLLSKRFQGLGKATNTNSYVGYRFE